MMKGGDRNRNFNSLAVTKLKNGINYSNEVVPWHLIII